MMYALTSRSDELIMLLTSAVSKIDEHSNCLAEAGSSTQSISARHLAIEISHLIHDLKMERLFLVGRTY